MHGRIFVGLLLSAALVWAMSPAAAAAAPVLPDLVADPPGVGYPLDAAHLSGRLLLRFDGYIHNVGPGKLEVHGRGPSNGSMTSVFQRIFNDDGTFSDPATPGMVMKYEKSDTHEHWHFLRAARYSLWNSQRSAEVGPSSKVGFCFLDIEQVGPMSAPKGYPDSCRYGQSDPSEVVMGISPGWRDLYESYLALQWVDISEVAPGNYWLRSEVDPDGLIKEQNEANAPGWATEASVVPGYLAKAVAAGRVAAVGTSTMTLQADKYGTPGAAAPEFKIVAGPSHGSLNRPTGTWSSEASVNYLPSAGYHGPDSFTFAARDSSSQFPLTPPAAAVTLQVGEPGQTTAAPLSTTAAAPLSTTAAAPLSKQLPALGKLVVTRRGRNVVASIVPGRSGRLRMALTRGHRGLGSCGVRAVVGKRAVCRFRLSRSNVRRRRLRQLKVTASLRVDGHVVAVRRGGVR